MIKPHYPLMDNEADHLHAFSGRRLSQITLNSITESDLSAADLRIHADTLRAQAEIARGAGYEQLAANLLRAAELTIVPNEELLQMYDRLRPGRASWEQLMTLAERLENTYQANENARFVREAAEAYKLRGFLRR
jgi:propanediol dehydratase small subunit